MSSKRVWAVEARYAGVSPKGAQKIYSTLDRALEDVEYLWDAGFGSSMRSYVVPA